MRVADLQLLPRFEDGLTFLYVEHVRIEQEDHAIVLLDKTGRVPVPIASLAVLMLGPGVSVTHAAVLACADNGCSLAFCGESGVRLYASGLGETRRATNLMEQARVWADPREHLQVVTRMYRMRFDEQLEENLTLQQIRGREGVRVRDTYARMSRETGIAWSGRAYRSGEWTAADPVNRALSTANTCLYGLCHAAIVSTGFSPGLGFVHTGKSLAFVYDVADLYKCDVTIPMAFRAAASGTLAGLEGRVRRICRRVFRESRLLERIVPDIHRVLGLRPETAHLIDTSNPDAPGELWDPDGDARGGVNYGALGVSQDEDGEADFPSDVGDPERRHVLDLEGDE